MMLLLLGASRDKWVALADGDLAFARRMTAAEARFDQEFFDDVVDERIPHFRDRTCLVTPSTLAGLPNSQVARIQWFSEEYCEPWNYFWARELQRCHGKFAPKWCNEQDREQDLTRHLGIKGYFDRLAVELESERGSLVRFNIMEVLVSRLRVWPLGFYPKGGLCGLMVKPVSAFLEHATVDDALTVGAQLSGPCSRNSELADAFRGYRDRADRLTDEQRDVLDALVAFVYTTKLRKFVETPEAPKKPLDPASFKTGPDASALLLARVQAHYELWRNGNIAALWDEQCVDARADTTWEECDRAIRWFTKKIPVVTASVRSVKVAGNLARVISNVTYAGSKKHGRTGQPVSDDETTYWVFENDNWFTWNLGAEDPDNEWRKREKQAVDVTFPEEAK